MIEIRLQLRDAIEVNLVAQLQQVLEQKRAQQDATHSVDVPPVPLGADGPVASPESIEPVLGTPPSNTQVPSDIEVTRAITNLAQTRGIEAARELLAEFGVKTAMGVPAERRAEFVARATS